MTVRFIGTASFNETPPDRRQETITPNPARRSTDGKAPWLVRRQESADRFEGMSRPSWRRPS